MADAKRCMLVWCLPHHSVPDFALDVHRSPGKALERILAQVVIPTLVVVISIQKWRPSDPEVGNFAPFRAKVDSASEL
jgi:hypothetical protein